MDQFVSPDEVGLFIKYHDTITEAFFPKRGYALKLSQGRQAISEFKKLGGGGSDLVNLMLHFVAWGCQYTLEYGDINEAFYNSIAGIFRDVLALAHRIGELDRIAPEAIKIAESMSDLGWGFGDEMMDLRYSYLPI